MSTLCRAERKWQKHGGAEKSAPKAFGVLPTHFSAFQERVNGCRRISDNPNNFGNISDKRPFPEIISDYFFSGSATVPVAVRGVSRRTSGQRCVWRDARHHARDARAPIKPTHRMLNLVNAGQIVCNYFKMNCLQKIRSNPVKVSQSESNRFDE
jgi:hypothetical protein